MKSLWQNHSLVIVAALMLSLASACTSKESKIKAAAIEGAKVEYQDEMKEEISKRVSGKTHLQATAVRILTEKATFEVVKFQDQGDEASALVEVRTEPEKVTDNLIDIMSKLEDQKEARFNVADAIKLIRQKIPVADGAYSLKSYRLNLENKNDWQALRIPKEK